MYCHTNTVYYSTERDLFEGEISAKVDSSSDMILDKIKLSVNLIKLLHCQTEIGINLLIV
jgi:hypothetical protein